MSLFTNGCKEHSRNYNVFLGASTLLSMAAGLFTPFWIVFIENLGSIQTLGFSMALMGSVSSIVTFFVGRHADRFGRKAFLMVSGYATAAILIAASFIDSVGQLYVVQVLLGISSAVFGFTEQVFLADITEHETRGSDYGRFEMVTGLTASGAMAVGGLLVGAFGFSTFLYIVATLRAVATTTLFFIIEPNQTR